MKKTRLVLWTVVILCMAAVLSSTVANSSSETIQVRQNGYYQYHGHYDEGSIINIQISTDGDPVDLMVMDSKNFRYYDYAANGYSIGWQTVFARKSVVKGDYNFEVPYDAEYYIVLDNTRNPSDGSYAGRPVNVYISIERAFD